MLRYFTAGESHGPCLTMIIDGVPAGFPVHISKSITIFGAANRAMAGAGGCLSKKTRRRSVRASAGARPWGRRSLLASRTGIGKIGQKKMSANPEDRDDKIAVTKPRPGHADLNGVLKYDRADIRDILERASARETVARTAVGLLRQATAGAFWHPRDGLYSVAWRNHRQSRWSHLQ